MAGAWACWFAAAASAHLLGAACVIVGDMVGRQAESKLALLVLKTIGPLNQRRRYSRQNRNHSWDREVDGVLTALVLKPHDVAATIIRKSTCRCP